MTHITQASINRGVNKETGETYFTIKSDSQADTWYTQTWNEQALTWECDCPRPSHLGCKHLRAVQEVLKSKRSECLDSRYDMPLNGGAKAFSLLK